MHAALPVAALMLLTLLPGCRRRHITDVPDDNPQMIAAIEKARATVPEFVAVLRVPKRSQSGFAVKMKFTDGDKSEYMWLSPVTYDGTAFHGMVSNDPEDVKTVKMGHRASIDAGQISDWMYIENGKLVGGHTTRVLLEFMTPEERREFDRTAPFTID